MLWQSIIAASAVMIVSLSGVVIFGRSEHINRLLNFFISLSVGIFLALSFVDLIPESLELAKSNAYYLLGGFLFFLALSQLLFLYHHHHDDECEDPHTRAEGQLVLMGDFIHNFVDGVTIAAAFAIDSSAGIAVTVGILLHELPQEVAEFFVLIRAGYSRTRAAFLNLASSSSVVIGVIISWFALTRIEHLTGPLLAVAAGNLIYISVSDILPRLVRQTREKQGRDFVHSFLTQFIFIVIGVILMSVLLRGE